MLASKSDSVTTTISVDRIDRKRIPQFCDLCNNDHDDNVIDYSINIDFELKTVLNMHTHRLTIIIERFVDYDFEAYAQTHTQYYRRAHHTNFRMMVNFFFFCMGFRGFFQKWFSVHLFGCVLRPYFVYIVKFFKTNFVESLAHLKLMICIMPMIVIIKILGPADISNVAWKLQITQILLCDLHSSFSY